VEVEQREPLGTIGLQHEIGEGILGGSVAGERAQGGDHAVEQITQAELAPVEFETGRFVRRLDEHDALAEGQDQWRGLAGRHLAARAPPPAAWAARRCEHRSTSC